MMSTNRDSRSVARMRPVFKMLGIAAVVLFCTVGTPSVAWGFGLWSTDTTSGADRFMDILNRPNDTASQAATLEMALDLLERATGPRTTRQSPRSQESPLLAAPASTASQWPRR